MDDALRARLYEAYATTHAGTGSAEGAVDLAATRDVIRHLPGDKGVSVVDLGCGQGSLIRAISQAGYTNVTGIDISPEQVEIARQRGANNVLLGDFHELLKPDSVDVIVATDFFEHFTKEEVVRALDSCYLALRIGGLLIFRVPNAVSPFGGNYRYGDFTHETSFTKRSLQQLANVAGFQSAQFFSCDPIQHGLKSGARKVIWGVSSSLLKLSLAAETGQLKGHIVSQNLVAVYRK